MEKCAPESQKHNEFGYHILDCGILISIKAT